MKAKDRYTISQLKKDFDTNEKCLEFIFNAKHSKKCSCGGEYKLRLDRRQYQCGKCRFTISPTSNTIFHKSNTSLHNWIFAIYLFSQAKSGISAKELQRHLGCTYKTAWRMLTLIRSAVPKSRKKLKGKVEMDEMHYGGRVNTKDRKIKHSINKTYIYGAISRKGDVRAKIMPDLSAKSGTDFAKQNISRLSKLITDGSSNNRVLKKIYNTETICHSKKEYVRGDTHINHIENFWGHVNRSIKGTYKKVSAKHLQNYVDSFVFHYNNRNSDKKRFYSLLSAVVYGVRD